MEIGALLLILMISRYKTLVLLELTWKLDQLSSWHENSLRIIPPIFVREAAPFTSAIRHLVRIHAAGRKKSLNRW